MSVGALLLSAARLGISVFKQEQERAIRSFVGGSDVFVSLPTGYGKSACFGSLPVMFDSLRRVPDGTSIVLVISPLKSLMKDQVASFCRKGLSAVFVGGERMDEATKTALLAGKVQLIFSSPEQVLQNLQWREMLRLPVYQQNLVALVVDEAHCVKDW